MSKQTNIRRRAGSPVYYARVTVPVALQRARAKAGLPARSEVWRSLHTTDPKIADRAGPAAVEQIKREFDRELDTLARGEIPENVRRHVPTDNEIEERMFSVLTGDLREDEASRLRYPRARDKERLFAEGLAKARAAAEGIADPKQAKLLAIVASLDEIVALDAKEMRTEQRRTEREAIVAGDPRDTFGYLAEELIESSNWAVPPESPLFSTLCQRLQSMRLRALDTMDKRDEGRFEDPPQAAPANIVALPQRAVAMRGERLLELLDEYLKDEGPRLSPEEIEKKSMVIRFFAEHVGLNRSVASITRADLRTFKQALDTLPLSATRKREFRGLDFEAIISKNAGLKRPTIGRSTQNNYISTVSAYWRWLHANAYTSEADLGRGLLRKVDKRETSRDSYSREELAAILRLPVFAGALSTDDVGRPGDVLVADWRFWIPLLCLFTGSRLGEIAQLRVQDIRVVDDEIALHITDEGEGMTVKNKHSVRVVPVHRELRRLGFERYFDAVRLRGVDRLFPELKKNRRGRSSSAAGSWWGKYLLKHGISGNAYRFRHTFADGLRQAGGLDAEIGSLLGHSGGTMTEHYGNISQVTLARRSALVNTVRFEDVEALSPRG